MSEYYDRQGNPLTEDEWLAWLRRGGPDRSYKRVAETQVGQLWVSTVWLGLNHNWNPDGPPLIFETMIFGPTSWGELGMWRYSTEAAALAGHDQAVAYARKRSHGLTKAARDARRQQMKEAVRLLATTPRSELEDALLQLSLGDLGRRR